jgi:uncharacterized membrane protein YdbT with pleckstrin-like domain
MPYVNKVLEPDERISYTTKISRVAYVPAWVVTAIGIISAIATAQYPFALYASLVVVVVGLVWMVFIWIRRVTTEIAVTDRRVILKTGLISRRTVEMNLTRIESVDVRQGVIGRLLNFGDVLIRGTGAGLEPIKGVDAPLEFRRRVLS